MRHALLLVLWLAAAPLAFAQILTTEVWLGRLDLRDGRFEVSELKNISNEPGYDNQPAFDPDGGSLLFASVAENLSETGLGVHAVRYRIDGGEKEPLVKARGFSPTPVRDGSGFMTLREGTVWLHDRDGNPIRVLLPRVNQAGYYTRIDDRRWVLFMNKRERSIAIWDEARQSLEEVILNAITAPYRIPGTNSVSFVIDDGKTKNLVRLDLQEDGGSRNRVLATIPFPTAGAHVWTSRGTLLIASGNELREWNPNAPGEWPVVHRFTEPDLQGVTRIALSPAGDRIALVSTPNDMAVLRESRDAANDAFAESVAAHRGTTWVRTPSQFEIKGETATERGTSVRRWRSRAGTQEIRGDYTVVWRRTVSPNGTAAWTVQREEYAADARATS